MQISAIECEKLQAWFQSMADEAHNPAIIEIAVNGDGARFKFDYGVWTPPMGELVAR